MDDGLASPGAAILEGPSSTMDVGEIEACTTIVDALRAHAAGARFKPFLVLHRGDRVKQLSYGDTLDEARRWACVLRRRGVVKGDHVVIALTHREEIYLSFLGAMWIGAIPTVIPFPTPKQAVDVYWNEYRAMLAHVEPRAVVTYAENVAPIQAALAGRTCALVDVDAPEVVNTRELAAGDPASTEPDDVALLQFSSGTTGLRKGVMLSHAQIARHMHAYGRSIGFGRTDTVASWLPLYHDMGLIACFLMPIHTGATVVSLDAFEWVARPWMLLDAIEMYRATFAWLPNFAFHHIVRTLPEACAFKLESMRAFINCSESCKPATFDLFAERMGAHGVRREQLQASYGMAETVFAVTQTPPGSPPRVLSVDRSALEAAQQVRAVASSHAERQDFLSCGRIIYGLDVRIVPIDDGRSTTHRGDNCVGEIQVRGSTLFSGYFRNEAASQAAIVDGWYRTGDIGFMEGGELFVCGRTKELVIVHGRNYYAHDIEAIASLVDGIKPGRAVAFGIDDPETGSEEAVVLAETEVVDPEERRQLKLAVKAAIFDRLVLTVRSVVLARPAALIKTTSGKLSRLENKARYLAEQMTEA